MKMVLHGVGSAHVWKSAQFMRRIAHVQLEGNEIP